MEKEKKFESGYFKNHKDHKVRELWQSYEEMTVGVYAEAYIALRMSMHKWNQKLAEGGIELTSEAFMNAHKYGTEITFYLKSLEELKNKMLPEDLKNADQSIEQRKTMETLISESHE